MPTSPATPRSDSPILPLFPRRLSSATTSPTLPRIAEQPQLQLQPRPQCLPHAQTFLYSPTIASPKQTQEDQDGGYTFLDSSSSSSSASSTSSTTGPSSNGAEDRDPHEKLPSCLSLQNLGFQDDGHGDNNAEDWTEGWEISTPPPKGTEGNWAKTRNSGPYGKVPTPDIPLIEEKDFGYYPKDMTKGGSKGKKEGGDDGSIKLARRRLAKRRSEQREMGVGKWLRGILKKIRVGRR